MRPAQVTALQDSFAQAAPAADSAATLFYTRLFAIAPEVKRPFKADKTNEGAKLMSMLGTVANGLDDLDSVTPAARELTVRHVAYGVEAEHYAPVGDALIHTLSAGHGKHFTSEVEDAWRSPYATSSGVMIEAAYPATAEP